MSWIREIKLTWVQNLCVKVLRMGPIPKHIAFIMDGNRRFAHARDLQTIDGHAMGFEKLTEALQWCLEMGITEVTVYAFSTENFKRSKEEVEGLMSLAKQKFDSLFQDMERLMEKGICIRVLGDLSRLPQDIQKMVANIVLKTKNNHKAFLNICVAYTSREEIVYAVKEVLEGVKQGLIYPRDISEYVLEKCLYSLQSSNPDMVIRTSGETRLSDFLVWQSSYSVLAFVKVLWPDFSIWNLFAAIIYYQYQCNRTKELQERSSEHQKRCVHESDRQQVIEDIKKTISTASGCVRDEEIEDKTWTYQRSREERIQTFLQHVHHKRLAQLEQILVQ